MSERVRFLASSLLSSCYDERVRAFNSILIEDMNENEEFFESILDKQFIDGRAAISMSNASKEDVDARVKMFESMTNTFDERMVTLRDVLFLI